MRTVSARPCTPCGATSAAPHDRRPGSRIVATIPAVHSGPPVDPILGRLVGRSALVGTDSNDATLAGLADRLRQPTPVVSSMPVDSQVSRSAGRRGRLHGIVRRDEGHLGWHRSTSRGSIAIVHINLAGRQWSVADYAEYGRRSDGSPDCRPDRSSPTDWPPLLDEDPQTPHRASAGWPRPPTRAYEVVTRRPSWHLRRTKASQEAGMSLYRSALQVVRQGTQAAEFLATAGAAGSAVEHLWHGDAVAGGLGGGVAVEDEQPAVPGREPGNQLARDVVVARDGPAGKAATTERRRVDNLVPIGIRQHGGHRAERLDLMRRRGVDVVATKQHRRQERALTGVGTRYVNRVRIAEGEPRAHGQLTDRGPYLVSLAKAGQGAHVGVRQARVAHHDAGKTGADRVGDGVGEPGGDERAPDGSAFLPCLDGHLGQELGDIQS